MKIKEKQSKNWRKVKLGELAGVVPGYAFKSDDFTNNGIPVIKIKNISSGLLNLDNIDYYSGEINGLEKYIIEEGDILISMTGSHTTQWSSVVGKIVRNNSTRKFLMNQRVGRIKPNVEKIDKNYLYYCLWNDVTTLKLANRASGSANQANISPEIIKSLELIVPNGIKEQKCIAAILSAFDDKIELNNKINQALEQMVQAIFKKWFIKFKFPGYKKSKFINRELGKIPEGWEIKKLKEVVGIIYGNGPSTKDLQKIGYPVYGANGIIGYSEKYTYEDSKIIIGCRGVVGSLFKTLPKATITHNSLIINPIDFTEINYLFMLLKNSNLQSVVSGSAQPQITIKDLSSMLVLFAEQEIRQKFEVIIDKIEQKRLNIIYENQKLSSLRDLLLPKLMNGKIRV